MKQILIYLKDGLLSPKGGPLGYNFYLKQQLDKMGVKNIHYIHSNAALTQGINKKIRSLESGLLKNFLLIFKSVCRKFLTLYGFSHKAEVNLDDYDIVHFHSTVDMYNVKDSLSKYKGKVILTSHTPTIHSKEMYDLLTPWEKKHMNWFYKRLIRIDRYAFNRADYILFPCPEAEEPYYNNWQEYSAIKENKKANYRYLLTGTAERKAKKSRKEICNEFNIPSDAFIISYAGRHNEIKGYDNLKKIGKRILGKYPNAYFLIAGREEPLQGLPDERWIEVGWTNDPHSLIAASDVFVLPNKETYFDLIMLEVLSLGTTIIASNVGGNRHFAKYKDIGVFLYNSLDEATILIDKIQNFTASEKKTYIARNKKLFEDNFSLSVFANNYIRLLDSI